MADKNVSIDITASDKTKEAFESVKKGLGDINKSTEVLIGAFTAFGALAGVRELAGLLGEAIKAAAQAELISNRLNAVIKATGDTSGFTRQKLDEMAESLSKATTFDDDGIREAQANLVKFGNIHGETFERALKLTADYAAYTGKSMQEASQAVGRALADHEHGLKALGKEFGSLTQSQKDNIEKWDSLGQTAKANELILNKLEASIGGTAGNINQGLYGATTAVTRAWDDFLKGLGKTGPVQVTTTGVLHLLAEGLDEVTDRIKKQNTELEKNPLYNGGKLQPLPSIIAGGPKSILNEDLNNTGVADINAAGLAGRKQQQDDAQAAAEARAKLMKEMIPLADELAKSSAQARIKQQTAANEMLADWEEAQKKEQQEFVDWADQLSRDAVRARQSQEEAASEMAFQYEEDRRKRLGILNDVERAERLTQIIDENRTEREIEDQHFIEQRNTLVAALAYNQIAFDDAARVDERMHQLHEKKLTSIQDEELKKRFYAANIYRKADVDSAGFFFNQLAGMMQSHSRVAFEIGKAAAISGAIIDTYKAATGAYAALAMIPFIGPALGAAAAAAAIVVGMARVSAIKSQTLGGGSGAVGTFAANPSTGLPDNPTSSGFEAPPAPAAQQVAPAPTHVHVYLESDTGMVSVAWVRDQLIPMLNDAAGDGVVIELS